MFTLICPTEQQLRNLIDEHSSAPFSYPEVGATRGDGLAAGYNVDRNRIRLGSCAETFQKATAALQSWAMFDLGWVTIFPENATIQPGSVVAVIASHFGFWSVNLSRIVYVDSASSFAYGTLEEHAESGEERFSVSMDETDGSVWFQLLAFSKPRHVLARTGYPLSRMLQKRFARDAMAAMLLRSR